MKNYLIIILVGLCTLLSCTKEYILENDNVTAVDFSTQWPDLEVTTKGDPVYIPNARTVRIVIRKSEEGATGPNMNRPIVANNTYYVNGAATALLTECVVDPAGLTRTGTGTAITLEPGFYDIYAYSPAIPLDAGDTTVTVKNNTDFMISRLYGEPIGVLLGSQKQKTIDLPTMQRLCSAIGFTDIYNEENIYIKPYSSTSTGSTLGRQTGFFIDSLYLQGSYKLGTDNITIDSGTSIGRQFLQMKHTDANGTVIYHATNATQTMATPKSNGVYDYTRLSTGTNVGNDIVYNKEFYILPGAANYPGASNKFKINFDLKFYSQTVAENNTDVGALCTPDIDGNSLKKGFKTNYKIKIQSTDMGKIITIIPTIIPWGDGGTKEIDL